MARGRLHDALVGKLSPAQTFTNGRPASAAAVNLCKVGVGVVGPRKCGCPIANKSAGAIKKSCTSNQYPLCLVPQVGFT